WFRVLLIPTWTRSWLIGEPRMIGWTMGEMVVTSVIVAAIFKRAIQLSDSWGAHILRSLTIPYAGSFVYLTVWNARVWTRTLLFGGLANLHDTMAVYYWGMCYAVVACFACRATRDVRSRSVVARNCGRRECAPWATAAP